MHVLALDFPPLSHIVHWPDIAFGDTPFAINKIVLIYFASAILSLMIFVLGNKKQMVPSGMQNVAEMAIDFVREGIVMETLGEKGLKYTPFMLSLFLYIFFNNIFEIIPAIQMPATARIALPLFLALMSYVIYNGAGFKEHGFFGYFKHVLFPPGVPVFLYILVTPIEFISNFLVKPFSHCVRLFANLLAGHILLVTFAVLCSGLFTAQWYAIFLPLPLFAVIFFTAFELLVSFLQAYVFTLLFGVYLSQAISHEH